MINAPGISALLPAGLADVLAPQAAFEAAAVERLMGVFQGWGYERVKPPLIEFEDTLLAGAGNALAQETFRLMDPVSQRMLALRPDMTMQIARIAASRLGHRPRPLRLGYAGQVVRVKGTQLRSERQFGQVGAELIGTSAPAADVEVILMAAGALADLGVDGLSIDLTLPTLVDAILAGRDLTPAARSRLSIALDRKDVAAVESLARAVGEPTARLLADLVASAGPVERALPPLVAATLPPSAAAQRGALLAVLDGLKASAPELTLTVDAVESRGFEYHSGVSFSLFARGAAGELGRGGRYRSASGEDATGVSLFMDAILRGLPAAVQPRRLFLPFATPASEARRLRAEGWITVAGLEAGSDGAAEAVRLGCSHVLIGGEIKPAESVGTMPTEHKE